MQPPVGTDIQSGKVNELLLSLACRSHTSQHAHPSRLVLKLNAGPLKFRQNVLNRAAAISMLLTCSVFRQTSLYGGRNRLQVAV